MKNAMVFRIAGLVLVVFMMIQLISPAIALEQNTPLKGGGTRDDNNDGNKGEPSRCHEEKCNRERCRSRTPDSFTEIPGLAFDHSLIESTPHWIFLAAGEKEKKALLDYIDQASVSQEKKSEWKRFMQRTWEKYPVAYEKTGSTPRLVPGNSHQKYSLTRRENETFREIETYIAEEMEMMHNNQIIVQWVKPMHSTLITRALVKENLIDDHYQKVAEDSSQAPDNWYIDGGYPFEHQYEHGFVPTGVFFDNLPWLSPPKQIFGLGTAPDNFGQLAELARIAYASRDYDDAFENMGYASHFISDLGNPYHTPMAQIIPLQFVDIPFTLIIFPNAQIVCNYKLLHDEYEAYANDHLAEFGSVDASAAITDPTYSAKAHGVASWAFSYPLMYQCYWHYVIYRNLDFTSSPGIIEITKNRITETAKLNRGLVRYVTDGRPITYTIIPSAAPGGSISPSSPVTISYGQAELFTITPDQGFIIRDVTVNGKSMGPVSRFLFNMDSIDKGTGEQTIDVKFTSESTASSDWIWARDGWGDWQHTASWSGSEAGPNSEYGPLIVEDHGQHGIQTNLVKGAAVASTWRTFQDPTGEGWEMVTFEGALSSSDRPSGRWMIIEVNGVQVFGANEVNIPPGSSGKPFTIKASFPRTDTATVNISHGQNPAWGPLFVMDYYAISFDAQSDVTMTQAQFIQTVLMDEDSMELNATEAEEK